MPTGTAWNLTATRKAKILDLLSKQWTISGIATQYGISHRTLGKALKADGIDSRAIRLSGLMNMRATAYESISDIDDPKDKAQTALKFLAQYPMPTDDEDVEEHSGKSITDDIAAQILLELSK